MYAEEALAGNVVISYSDIVFSPAIVERLLDSSADISIVVDIDWRGRYVDRKDHPIEEAENAIFDANHKLVDIGKIVTSSKDVHGEFIGMMKLSPKGAEVFKRHFHRAKEVFWDKPFQKAATFQNAYITDILKDMTDFGVPIHTVIIERGWQEIDTIEDYENAKNNLQIGDFDMPVLSIKQLLSISILLLALLSPARAADPDVLNMVFVPASEKGDESDYESLIKIISDQAKIEIKTIKVIDYNAAVEAMRAGRAHIAWYGGKTYIKAAEIANAQAFAAGVRKGDDNAGYYSYFVVRSDSPLEALAEVKGKTLWIKFDWIDQW